MMYSLTIERLLEQFRDPTERKHALITFCRLSTALDEQLVPFLNGDILDLSSDLDLLASRRQKETIVSLFLEECKLPKREWYLKEIEGEEGENRAQLLDHMVEILRNMSRSKVNRKLLFEKEGFVANLLDFIGDEKIHSAKAKERAIGTLNNLVLEGDYAVSLFGIPAFYDRLFTCLREHPNKMVKAVAIRTLGNTALIGIIGLQLFERVNFYSTLLEFARHGGEENKDTRDMALYTLMNLATPNHNKTRMMTADNLEILNIIQNCLETEKESSIRMSAVGLLMNLAVSNTNAAIIPKTPGIIDCLYKSLKSDSPDIVQETLGAFVNLCFVQDNIVSFYANHKLLFAFLDLHDEWETKNSLTNRSDFLLDFILRKLSCTSSVIKFFKVMITLCSVKDVSRLGGRKCTFQSLPRELVRLIGEMMAG